MGLAPAEPDQVVIDGLLMDAAWDHAKDLEVQVDNLRRMLENSEKAWRAQTAKRAELHGQLEHLADRYKDKAKGNPALTQLLAELMEIYYERE